LLEKERYIGGEAAVPEVAKPLDLDCSVARPRFASGDDPVNSAKVESFELAEQGLGAYELDYRTRASERVDSYCPPPVLD
jgi:hypothetical protein